MGRYAVELELEGCPVLVVGLGRVGQRKASGLLEAGARVIGVDPFAAGPSGIVHVREPFRAEHLEGVGLAFAAATAEVNRAVVREAKARGVRVNSASEPDEGDLFLPATHRSGLIHLSVSTSGVSPPLATMLRDILAQSLGPEPQILAELLAEFRPQALSRVPDAGARRRLLLDWATLDRLEQLKREGPDSVRQSFQSELETASRV